MSVFKFNTSKVLFEYYEENGIEKTLALGRKMFEHSEFRRVLSKNSPIVQGTVAEAIAHIQAVDFIRKNNLKDWGVHEGLIIKGTDTTRTYLTELDLLVYSPSIMILLEVKSYGGTKTISRECTITTEKQNFDVYGQHSKHMEALLNLFGKFKSPEALTRDACLPVVFLYSIGPIIDSREEVHRINMPVITEREFPRLLGEFIDKPVVWDVRFIKEALRIMESKKESLTKDHLKYVKGLRRK